MASIYTYLELSRNLEAARDLSAYRGKAYDESRQDFEKWLQTHHCIKTMHKIKYYDKERYGYYVYVQGATIDPHTVQFIDVETFDRRCKAFRSEIEFFREQSNDAFGKFLKADRELTEYMKVLTREECLELKNEMWSRFNNRSCA